MKIKKYIEIIRQKRKHTQEKDFIVEILSWVPMKFYRNSGEISRFPETTRTPKIVSREKFIEERNNQENFGIDYKNERTFFENFEELFKNIPMPATIEQMGGENTKYADMIVSSSNCYLSNMVIANCSNIFYSFHIFLECYNIFHSVKVRKSENIYNCIGIDESNKVFFSKYITNSSEIYFSSNLFGCKNCIFCNDLENCEYYVQNKKYSKKDFEIKKKELFSQNHNFEKFYSNLKAKPKNVSCKDSSGEALVGCENVLNSRFVNYLSNGINVYFSGGGKDFYDAFDSGFESNDLYGVASVGTNSSNIYCSNMVENSYNMFYSYNCNNSSHCFGCIGLVNKSYYILNKKYDKNSWEIKVCEIMEKMNKSGALGNFFPIELNPFYYNKTLASIFQSLDSDSAKKLGFLWEEDSNKKEGHIPIEEEKKFLKKYNLAIPKIHWEEKIKQHFKN